MTASPIARLQLILPNAYEGLFYFRKVGKTHRSAMSCCDNSVPFEHRRLIADRGSFSAFRKGTWDGRQRYLGTTTTEEVRVSPDGTVKARRHCHCGVFPLPLVSQKALPLRRVSTAVGETEGAAFAACIHCRW